MTEPAWLADPTGRHQARYWNGRDWTEHVANNGAVGVDSPTMPQPPAPAPFPSPVSVAVPTQQQSPSSPQRESHGRWWIIAIPVAAIAAVVAVVAMRDSNHSTSSSGAAGPSSGATEGKSVRVEFTNSSGYQYVVEHNGAVELDRSIAQVSPGFEVVHAVGGKVSVVNANTGRNAPMPDVELVAYVAEPECGFQSTVVPNPAMRTEVSVSGSCFIKSSSGWSIEADEANGLGSVDNLDRNLAPGQTAVAAVDETWADASDLRAAVPDTTDLSGPFVWGIEIVDDPTSRFEDAPPTCVIRLVGRSPLVQQLIDTEAQVDHLKPLTSPFSPDATYRCDVGAA